MESLISHLIEQFERGGMTRRQLIQSLALAAAAAPVSAAQSGRGGLQASGLRTLNLEHINFVVTDYRRTRDFYASLMGMTVANDNGKDSCELHFGDARGVGVRDRAMMSLHNAPAPPTPQTRMGIDHLAFKIADWDTNRVQAELERRGLRPRLARGGAIDTPNYMSFMVQDPDGLGVQISGIAPPGEKP